MGALVSTKKVTIKLKPKGCPKVCQAEQRGGIPGRKKSTCEDPEAIRNLTHSKN